LNKGTAFEYRIIKIYEKKGWNVMRSAGSHGIADLLAYKEGHRDHLIQCKNVRKQREWKREKDELIEYCKRVDKVPIWAWNHFGERRGRGKTIIKELSVTNKSAAFLNSLN
jgi:Holliday junction resolvase